MKGDSRRDYAKMIDGLIPDTQLKTAQAACPGCKGTNLRQQWVMDIPYYKCQDCGKEFGSDELINKELFEPYGEDKGPSSKVAEESVFQEGGQYIGKYKPFEPGEKVKVNSGDESRGYPPWDGVVVRVMSTGTATMYSVKSNTDGKEYAVMEQWMSKAGMKIASVLEHELVIDSLRDPMAHCTCGGWEFASHGFDDESDDDLRKRIDEQFKMHTDWQNRKSSKIGVLDGLDLGSCYNCKFVQGASEVDATCGNPKSPYYGTLPESLRCSYYGIGDRELGSTGAKTAQDDDGFFDTPRGMSDADMEMSQLEEMGNRASDLKAKGVCPHGWFYTDPAGGRNGPTVCKHCGKTWPTADEAYDEHIRLVKGGARTAAWGPEIGATCPECGENARYMGQDDWYRCLGCGMEFDPGLDARIYPETVQDIEDSREYSPKYDEPEAENRPAAFGSKIASIADRETAVIKWLEEHGYKIDYPGLEPDIDAMEVGVTRLNGSEISEIEALARMLQGWVPGISVYPWNGGGGLSIRFEKEGGRSALRRAMAAVTPDELEQARQLGEQAFQNGYPTAPAQCPGAMALISKHNGDNDAVISILDAWNGGWHNANLAGDIPEWTDEENQGLRDARGKTAGRAVTSQK